MEAKYLRTRNRSLIPNLVCDGRGFPQEGVLTTHLRRPAEGFAKR